MSRMTARRRTRRNEKGQATIEFLIVFPLIFSLFLLALAIAAVWHGHHLSSAISLEAASREGAQAGSGSAFVYDTGRSVTQNTEFAAQVADFDSEFWAPGRRLTVSGNVSVPWVPLGLNWNVPVQGTTFYPVWEFYGE